MSAAVERAAQLLAYRRPDEALRALGEAGSDAVEDPSWWYVRALALRQLDRRPEALEACQQGLGRAPWHAPMHDLVATVQIDLDELARAEQSCLRALALSPEDPEPWCTYAHACALAGQLDKAWALLDQAAALDPESIGVASARVSVAWLAADEGLTERYSKELLARDPEHERGLTMLGLTRANRGQTDSGMEVLRTAVMLNPRPDGPVQVARQVRLQQHWAMWPQRLLARVGIGPMWISVLVMLFALVAADAPRSAFTAAGGAWVLLAVWSWVAPAIVRRSQNEI